MSNKINFIRLETAGMFNIKPVPAKKNMPKWWSDMSISKKLFPSDRLEDFTIKKCTPVLDTMLSGYYLSLTEDLYYDSDESNNHYQFSINLNVDKSTSPVQMHPFEQIKGIDIPEGYSKYAFKWSNPYVIKTPPGYSCMFMHPSHRELPFKTMSGIVDTDEHELAIQFPFIMKSNYSGTIPKGTPIVQLVPFLREEWKMEIYEHATYDQMLKHSQEYHDQDKSRRDHVGNPTTGRYTKIKHTKKRFS